MILPEHTEIDTERLTLRLVQPTFWAVNRRKF